MKHRTKRRQPQVTFVTNDAAPAKRLSKRARQKLAHAGKGFSTQRADPSRTLPMRKAMVTKLRAQFDELKKRMLAEVTDLLTTVGNANPNHDELGHFASSDGGKEDTWLRKNVSGWVMANGKHLPLEPEDRGHHVEAARRVLGEDMDSFPFLIEQKGWARLRQEVPGDTLHVEVHHSQYDKVKRIVEGSVNPHHVKNVEYTVYTGVPFQRPKVIRSSLTDNTFTVDIDDAAAEADTQPSQAQIDAGNYRHGHVRIQGLDITIETAKGVKRKPHHDKPVAAHYGYVKARGGIQTSDADGDHVDVFIGPHPDSDKVWAIDQRRVTENVNPNHDEMGRFASVGDTVTDVDRSHSDPGSLKEAARSGDAKEGINVAEPRVYHVQDGKATQLKHLEAEYQREGNLYRLVARTEPWPEDVPKVKTYKEVGSTEGSKKLEPEHIREVSKLAGKLTDAMADDKDLNFAHNAIESYQQGVMTHHESRIDEIARGMYDAGGKWAAPFIASDLSKQVHDHFEPAREAIRAAVGDHVTLYRGTDETGTIKDKTLSSYAATKKLASEFAYEDTGRVLKTASIPVDAIYAVVKTPNRPLEFLIDNRRLSKHLATNLSQEDFDEHKVMLGFTSKHMAVQAYKDSYSDGWPVGDVTELTMDQFKRWLREGDTGKPMAGQYIGNYRPFVRNGQVGWHPVEQLIEVPDIRQRDHYSCGAAATMSVGRYFGVGPSKLEQWKKLLGTDVEESTKPTAIVSVLEQMGLTVESHEQLTIDDLERYTSQDMPVICPIQDYGPRVPKQARYSYGHYISVIGVGAGYVFCQDSSEDNVIAGGDDTPLSKTGSVQKPGRVMIDVETFDKIWHDKDIDGNVYDHFGIVVGRPATENVNPEGHNQYTGSASAVTVKVLHVLKGVAFRSLSALALKSMDQWLFEQTVNAHQPGTTAAVKAAVMATSKAYIAAKRLTGNSDDAENLHRVMLDLEEATDGAVKAWTLERTRESMLPVRNSNPNHDEAGRFASSEGLPKLDGMTELPVKDGTVFRDEGEVDRIGSIYNAGHVNYTINPTKTELKSLLEEHGALRGLADHNRVVVWPENDAERAFMRGKIGGGGEFTVQQRLGKAEVYPRWKHGWPEDWDAQHPYFRRMGFTSDDHGSHLAINLRFSQEHAVRNAVPHALDAFQTWLKKQLQSLIVGKTQEQLWDDYVQAGFRKGAGRAFDDVRKPYAKGYAADKSTTDFYNGSKEEFLRSSFGQPVAKEKVKLMSSRTFDELENVTTDMSNKMSRVLTDGLIEGKSPHDVAKDMTDEVDVSRARAEMVARTEIIRVHAEGQLIAFEQLGVEELGVDVEFSDASDDKVCEECSALDGETFSIEEAHGVIPVHPSCRCCFRPSGDVLTGNMLVDDLRVKEPTALERLDESLIRNRRQLAVNALNLSQEACWLTGNCNVDFATMSLAALAANHAEAAMESGDLEQHARAALAHLRAADYHQGVIANFNPHHDALGRFSTGDGNGSDRQAGGRDVVRIKGAGRRVASKAGRSNDAIAGRKGAGQNRPAGQEAAVDPALAGVNDRLDRYAKVFAAKGNTEAAEFMAEMKEHISSVGTERALEALGEAKAGNAGRVQYEGAYDELGDTKQEGDFIKAYLQKAGVNLVQQDTEMNPDLPHVSTWSEKNLKEQGRPERTAKAGDYLAKDASFANDKLQEAKLLHGDDKAEDVSKLMGKQVTNLTPDVTSSLDEKYGKGGWVVKSYGEEAYAGFGVIFSQRAAQVKGDAKAVIADARSQLKDKGYGLVREDKGGEIIGISKGKRAILFGGEEFDHLPKGVQTLGKQVRQAAPNEHGMRMPRSSEDVLQNDYGMTLRRGKDGVPNGVVDWDGREHALDSKFIQKFENQEGGSAGKILHRALERDEDRRNGFNPDPKFYVEPANKALGVTASDRAAGATWETAREGRVHVITRDGKAEAVPYATMMGRGDSIPVVFHNDDSRAMEKAVQDAVNKLPVAERSGQMYAPDVMKTKDGWKVIELNPAAVGGGSDWLGGNPLVIDAVASHVVGREPMHVKFVRDLLQSKGVKTVGSAQQIGADELPRQEPGTIKGGGATVKAEEAAQDRWQQERQQETVGNTHWDETLNAEQPRMPAGTPDGGQFVSPGTLGATNTVTHGNLKVQYAVHTTKRINGPNIPLPNYKQHDDHSCSFVAALTTVHHFDKNVPPVDVLRAVRPTKNSGMDRRGLQDALGTLGVAATYKKDLTIAALRKHVEQGTPVLITVLPPDWSSDHWTVVQGFSGDRIHLSNHKSMPIRDFVKEWYDKGEGLVCKKH